MTSIALPFGRNLRRYRFPKRPEQVGKPGRLDSYRFRTKQPQRVLGNKGQRDRKKAIDVMVSLLEQIASSGNYADALSYIRDIQEEARSDCSNKLFGEARNTFANVLRNLSLGHFAHVVRNDEDLITKLTSVIDKGFVNELKRSIARALCA